MIYPEGRARCIRFAIEEIQILLANEERRVVNRVRRRQRYWESRNRLTVNKVVHHHHVGERWIVIGSESRIAANDSDARDGPIADGEAQERKTAVYVLGRHSLLGDEYAVGVEELHSRVVGVVDIGKDRAETFGQVVLHDHFHIICLPGKDSRVGRRVHGDRGSGAVVVKAVGCGQTQSGALCGVFFLACCHAILGEIYLKQAGRGCQGRSICCRLGVTPLLQHAPAVHADRKHADEHNQTDKHPDCYSSSPCGLAGNDRMDQHAWTLRQLKIWTESPSSVPRKTSVSRWCSAN